MKLNLFNTLFIVFVTIICQSCNNKSPQNSTSIPDSTSTTRSTTDAVMEISAFNDVNQLVTVLSQNGIGALKPWQNPMDLGYGSLTDYYPIGTSKTAYGLTNNLAYYLEGSADAAKNLQIILNINNPDEMKQGLIYLSNVTAKTFKSLKIKIPTGLLQSIKSHKAFKADNPHFTTSFRLEQSKIETLKVLIVSK